MALLPLQSAKAKTTLLPASSHTQRPIPMEEMMMVMMKIRSHETSPQSNANMNMNMNIPIITTTTRPAWKLYENPYYISHNQQQDFDLSCSSSTSTDHQKQVHKLHLPISSRKIAASFWDLTFLKPFMESQLTELKAELESERKARKKMESLNKRLARELKDERRGREALERVCEELAKEISSDKDEISRMKREIDEERKMLRTAEVIREERVQMKLSEAKILLEEKFSEMEMEMLKRNGNGNGKKNQETTNSSSSMAVMQRKSCIESENPHIKRGIKGFVEFPKVVRAIGCRSSKHLGSKLECQKAQLKILLKQKGTVRFNGLFPS